MEGIASPHDVEPALDPPLAAAAVPPLLLDGSSPLASAQSCDRFLFGELVLAPLWRNKIILLAELAGCIMFFPCFCFPLSWPNQPSNSGRDYWVHLGFGQKTAGVGRLVACTYFSETPCDLSFVAFSSVLGN